MSIKKIILVFFLFLSILANAQEEFDAYSHKAPTIGVKGFIPCYYSTSIAYIGRVNNGGYALKRAGVIFCNNCPDDPLTIPDVPQYLVEWTTNLTYVGTSEFVQEVSGVTFTNGDVFRQRWFIETSSGQYFYGPIQENTVNCDTPTPSAPTVETCSSPTSKTYNSAYVCGEVTSAGSSSIGSFGIAYSTTPNVDTSDNVVYGTGDPLSQWSVQLTGLNANTVYYYRAFATNSEGTGYGSEYNFITSCNQSTPTLTTATTSNITTTTATSGGTITNDGNASIIERGVCWNTAGTPTYNDSKTSDGTGVGSFTSNLTNLSPNTTYYVRAYARNRCNNGGFYVYATGYGQQEVFTTNGSGTLPTVTTRAAYNETVNSALSGGNVTSDGGSPVTARGVCWSTNSAPTIADSKTIDGSGTGSFTSSITGLSCGTMYYVRAYATNSTGTSYGNQDSFIAGNSQANTVVGLYYTVNTPTCGNYSFTTKELACQAMSEYFGSSCGDKTQYALYGGSFRFESFAVGSKIHTYINRCLIYDGNPSIYLVYFDGATSQANARIVHLVYGVIESITTCP